MSFFCDLDEDGVYESMIQSPHSGKAEENLLISLIKFKLGIVK
jgi:hypothetical protein